MKTDIRRKKGFYWIRFEGQLIVAEYVGVDGQGIGYWQVPGTINRYADSEVCELLSSRLHLPGQPTVIGREQNVM